MNPDAPDSITVAERLDKKRISVSGSLNRKHRSALGQFFTPTAVADFMASLLVFPPDQPVNLLDPGAGIGALTAAAAHKAEKMAFVRFNATCYELEPEFQSELGATLAHIPNVVGAVIQRDFIEDAVRLHFAGKSPAYSHVILNPPYKKINTGSSHRYLMRRLGVETSNLYTCFLACSIALCETKAQVVAIIPRSFMNGPYFKPFRHWLLDRVALTHIHIFDSRSKAFADDGVLQENVILRMVVGASQGDVQVTASTDHHFNDVRHNSCPFSDVVTPADSDLFIHVPSLGSASSEGLPGFTLQELGLDVCTGPVVDFRLREHIRPTAESGAMPLLYASHFAGGRFEWPREGRKPNSIVRNSETEKWLMPNGCYVILRRFSSKEEKRRVVAYLFDGSTLPGEVVGFENHLNVLHKNKAGLSPEIAHGLTAYLNSQAVDDYFRTFSGHTQVNATDLRRLRYPSLEELEKLGRDELAQVGPRGVADTD
jgi:adenine-specific DNA-methyltransferase